MSRNDLIDYMMSRTEEMQSEYLRIQKRSKEDPGTAGDNGEENWKEIIEKWLPPYFKCVTKGRIMNIEGLCGPQVDLLILSPEYPAALIGKKEYLEAGVVAAFECKLTLRARDLASAVNNSIELRRNICPPRVGDSPRKELNSRLIYGLLAHSHEWKNPQSKPVENIESQLATQLHAVGHPRECLDVICVADLASWTNQKLYFPPQAFKVNPGMEVRYPRFPWQNGVIEAGYLGHDAFYKYRSPKYVGQTPIGSLVTDLLNRMGWEHPALRTLAEYFVGAYPTSGAGSMRPWSVIEVCSPSLIRKMPQNRWGGQGRWDEWGCTI